jgi:hypothetical protein
LKKPLNPGNFVPERPIFMAAAQIAHLPRLTRGHKMA